MLEDPEWGGPVAMDILRQADEEWIDLMLHLACASSADVSRIDRVRIRSTIFGPRMGHISAEKVAFVASSAGLVQAFPTLIKIAGEHGIDVSRWSKPLGLPELLDFATTPPSPSQIAKMCEVLRNKEKAARDAYNSSVIGQTDEEDKEISLWVEALGAPGPMHVAVKAACAAAALPSSTDSAVRIALARVLGTPVWTALNPLAPESRLASASACGLCNQTAPISAGRGTCGNRSATGGGFDTQGEHVAACRRSGPEASNLTRHNRLAKVAAEIGLHCGFISGYHDGPAFDREVVCQQDRDKRPADWFETGAEATEADGRRYYGGRFCDLTIRTGARAQLNAAVREKEAKYARAMAAHPHIALTIFGISHTGAVSAGGVETLRRWAACLTRHRKAAADIIGNPQKEVRAAFGLAFAMVMALQLAAYAAEVNNCTSHGRGPWPLPPRTAPRPRGNIRPLLSDFGVGLNSLSGLTTGAPPAKRVCARAPPQRSANRHGPIPLFPGGIQVSDDDGQCITNLHQRIGTRTGTTAMGGDERGAQNQDTNVNISTLGMC